ncbi:MAG TPA: hypothetical protein VNN09_06585 [Candidatus Competibacteraceae bacterium]|nr:hypothetical protein [Candidatus Competibacteraceae bacterium]
MLASGLPPSAPDAGAEERRLLAALEQASQAHRLRFRDWPPTPDQLRRYREISASGTGYFR